MLKKINLLQNIILKYNFLIANEIIEKKYCYKIKSITTL